MIIRRLECEACGWSPGAFLREGTLYAVDGEGKRVPCRHPLEQKIVREVLGGEVSPAEAAARTGREHPWLCANCGSVSVLDPERDRPRCSSCGSRGGGYFLDLDGTPCPRCGRGALKETDTGCVT